MQREAAAGRETGKHKPRPRLTRFYLREERSKVIVELLWVVDIPLASGLAVSADVGRVNEDPFGREGFSERMKVRTRSR